VLKIFSSRGVLAAARVAALLAAITSQSETTNRLVANVRGNSKGIIIFTTISDNTKEKRPVMP
jgi:hypothetical protein